MTGAARIFVRLYALPAAFVAVLLLSGTAAATDSPRAVVPLTLRSAVPAAVPVLPVTGGVPFPQGVFREGMALAVRDGEAIVATQSRVLSRWPDGSVRWLLVDWQSRLAPGESRRLRLEVGTPTTLPASPVRFSRKAEGVVVDTGAARFLVPFAGPSLVTRVASDGAPSPTLSAYARLDGERYDVGARREIETVDAGPWRVRLRVRGALGPFRQEVRFDFFAGMASFRVLHSIENHASAAYTTLDALALVLSLPTPASSLRFQLTGGSSLQADVSGAGANVVQVDADRIRVDGRERRARGSGWATCGAGVSQAAIAARFFWQEYPQGVRCTPEAFTYELRAPSERTMPFGTGAAKTHEVWILPQGSLHEAEMLQGLAEPVLPRSDASWTVASGALRNSLAPGPATEPFLLALDTAIAGYFKAQAREEWDDSGRVTCSDGDGNKRIGAYGMLNWGDWNFRGFRDTIKGCDAWGNLEYDTTQVLALAYAARGEPAHFQAMTAAARHFADVDRIHFSPEHPSWVGMNHPKNPLHFTFELGGIDIGHTWTEGLFSYGVLTGDDRALRAGREIADYLVRRRGGITFRGNPRQWGWPQIALVAAWEFSGDERYREAALWYAQRGMFAHPADGRGDWKRGILAEGLAYTHSVTGDATIAEWLQAYAGVVADTRPDDVRFYPALPYAARIGGKPEWARIARTRMTRVQFGRWGKPLTIAGRVGFATLAADLTP